MWRDALVRKVRLPISWQKIACLELFTSWHEVGNWVLRNYFKVFERCSSRSLLTIKPSAETIKFIINFIELCWLSTWPCLQSSFCCKTQTSVYLRKSRWQRHRRFHNWADLNRVLKFTWVYLWVLLKSGLECFIVKSWFQTSGWHYRARLW